MKKIVSKQTIIFIILLAIFGIAVYVIGVKYNILTPLILIFTLLAIIWYSWETRQLKIETRRMRKWTSEDVHITKKQSITNIRPYLRLQKNISVPHLLQLVNEGKGVAVNLEPIYVKGRKQIPLLRIPAMAAAPNSNTISFIPKDFSIAEQLDPEISEYMIKIKYEDIEGRLYEVVFQSDVNYNDKFGIISQEEIKQAH